MKTISSQAGTRLAKCEVALAKAEAEYQAGLAKAGKRVISALAGPAAFQRNQCRDEWEAAAHAVGLELVAQGFADAEGDDA